MRIFVLTSVLVLAAPTAFAQKTDGKPEARTVAAPTAHPFVGDWNYVVRPDDPVAQGVFTIESHGNRLGGMFMTDDARPIDPFEGAGDVLSFTFKQPGMGVISISGTLAGDRFEGEAQPEGQDALPIVATRSTAEPTDAP